MTNNEKLWKRKLADMPCLLCVRIYGEHEGGGVVELHHLRSGGFGKGDYTTLIPLCYDHHRGVSGIHTLGTKAWERHFDVSQKDLLNETREKMQ